MSFSSRSWCRGACSGGCLEGSRSRGSAATSTIFAGRRSCAGSVCVPVLNKSRLNLIDMTVSVESDEEVELVCDALLAEHTGTCLEVGLGESHRTVAWLHRVDKVSGLGVAEVAQCSDVESCQHLVVFVDQIVAAVELISMKMVYNGGVDLLKHVDTVPWRIACDNLDLLVGV